MRVTDGTLPLLGVPPLLGRTFTKEDDSPGALETVILTYGYWRHKFGGDPSAIGKTLIVDGKGRQIIGVMPQRFRFLDQDDLALLTPFQFERNKVFLGNSATRPSAGSSLVPPSSSSMPTSPACFPSL